MVLPLPRVSIEVTWRPIPDFPGYSVSSNGDVRNELTGRILRQFENRQGVLYVGLSRGGIQFSRGVALLVAEAFMLLERVSAFDTPIHLDGDLRNNHASNLLWRPRWFSIKYHRQFRNQRLGTTMIVEDVDTKLRMTPREFAVAHGILIEDIHRSAMNYGQRFVQTSVWPTRQQFRLP